MLEEVGDVGTIRGILEVMSYWDNSPAQCPSFYKLAHGFFLSFQEAKTI